MYFVRFVKLTNLFKTQTVNALNWELGSKPGIIFNHGIIRENVTNLSV